MPPKPSPTHFLCVPLVTPASRPQLVHSLGSFLADVSSPASFGVPEDAVRPVGTLHLTLGVFSLPRSESVERAKELLRSLKPREMLAAAQPPGMPAAAKTETKTTTTTTMPPLTVTLRGLESMQAPSKAAVLYAAPVDPLGTLQGFCEKLRAAFQEAELMAEESRPLLLHATILNTVYVRGRRKNARRGERLTIDARGILDRYEDQVWMEDIAVEKIAICRMGAKKIEVDGIVVDEQYVVEEEIPL